MIDGWSLQWTRHRSSGGGVTGSEMSNENCDRNEGGEMECGWSVRGGAMPGSDLPIDRTEMIRPACAD